MEKPRNSPVSNLFHAFSFSDRRCGDILDPPYEPETIGLIVDKGVLDCVGMRVPPESFDGPGFGPELRSKPKPAWNEDPEDTPLEEWSQSMHRLLAPNGYLLIVSCCFHHTEIQNALDTADSMFAEDGFFRLVKEAEQLEGGSSCMRIFLFQKVANTMS